MRNTVNFNFSNWNCNQFDNRWPHGIHSNWVIAINSLLAIGAIWITIGNLANKVRVCNSMCFFSFGFWLAYADLSDTYWFDILLCCIAVRKPEPEIINVCIVEWNYGLLKVCVFDLFFIIILMVQIRNVESVEALWFLSCSWGVLHMKCTLPQLRWLQTRRKLFACIMKWMVSKMDWWSFPKDDSELG